MAQTQTTVPLSQYVLYSNANQGRDIDWPEDPEFDIYTKSPVGAVEGSQIWFISGRGSPKQFRLCYTFIADKIGPRPDGQPGSKVSGTTGVPFDPAIPLNDHPWFAELRRIQFQSLGLVEVKSPEVVEGLISLLEALAEDDEIPDMVDVVAELEFDIAASLSLSRSKRLERLQAAPVLPARFEVIALAFNRNPDVIAEVLLRAEGTCEKCNRPAPFIRRSSGTPYLEVHHWISLSEGGEDTAENAGALCPNCHREAHFG